MTEYYQLALKWFEYVVVVTPVALVFALGLPALLNRKLPEPSINRLVQVTTTIGLVASLGVLACMLLLDIQHDILDLGNWVAIHDHGQSHGTEAGFHFLVKFVFDRLSMPFLIMTYVLCGTIGAFASRYMHREQGYNRFYVQYAFFLLGLVTAGLAGTIETLFAGWELVGLSSTLLIVFFQDRPAPARNGLRVWVVYRVSDACLLLAAIVMHHMLGAGDFDILLGHESWPDGHAHGVTMNQAVAVGFLLLAAAAGKSALVPFSGWLPRAMEGPTPSSAVFYGALSVHLGAYLLLRVTPVLEMSIYLSAATFALGLITAAYGSLAGRVQTDIKAALSFASLAQVGVIVAEIGAGGFGPWFAWLRYVALIHLIGHAFLRTLQFVRAPSLLQDYRTLENAIGSRLPRPGAEKGAAPSHAHLWLYRAALERGYLDALLTDYVVYPFVRTFRFFDGIERRWTDLLAGRASRESDDINPTSGKIEELS
ncbi:proton-conducting transporter membrane subunit [Fimbriiglobus ruber]|uniref:NADH-ubiquinone oxidoreductase chain L n=1 Tax=Fimbriiglobus ruber TaxID=1908690 RepID=A0A225D7U0_9BACT|nr:proton-conducting transporter membrane subunit [Fimbriiglobus ruber]OWK37670.1 NADH-ubiquinone oxidoreductase chain L [Fimbriiglobus ruber]